MVGDKLKYIGNQITHKKMKKLFQLIALLLLIQTVSKAQGDLQFNKVKLISTQDTVPNGKIWKVESFIFSQTIPNCPSSSTNQDETIKINGQNISVRSSRFMSGFSWGSGPYGWSTAPVSEFNIWEQKLPIWLPSGNIISAEAGVLYISALEYNIIP